MWYWFNIIITAPALIATAAYTVPPEIKHLAHLKEHPSEFVGFPYLRKRSRQFPWGDDSLFHSDHANPVFIINLRDRNKSFIQSQTLHRSLRH